MADGVRIRARAGVLAAAALLPLALGGPAAAHTDPGSAAPPAPGGSAVPLGDLVPGEPLPAGALVTPDEVHGAPVPARQPSVVERGVTKPTVARGSQPDRVEYVPADDLAALHRARAGRPYCSPHTGPYQRQVERFLGLAARERQTARSCAVIRRYQRGHGIRPAIGFAGPVTWGTMLDTRSAARGLRRVQRLALARSRCPAGDFTIACVDQNRQLMWVQAGREVVFGPVRVRTGRPSTRTRDGLFRVYLRHRHHVSSIYHSPMPYAQFFDGGIAFHGVYDSVYAPPGSYGCVNMRLRDARRLWNLLRTQDRVYVWGRRPA